MGCDICHFFLTVYWVLLPCRRGDLKKFEPGAGVSVWKSHKQIIHHNELILDSQRVKESRYDIPNTEANQTDMISRNNPSIPNAPSTTVPPSSGQSGSNTDSSAGTVPVDLQNLSPLQRQRLDAAVMMLVNYLVSASSGD
jgi:hypothetical protein